MGWTMHIHAFMPASEADQLVQDWTPYLLLKLLQLLLNLFSKFTQHCNPLLQCLVFTQQLVLALRPCSLHNKPANTGDVLTFYTSTMFAMHNAPWQHIINMSLSNLLPLSTLQSCVHAFFTT